MSSAEVGSHKGLSVTRTIEQVHPGQHVCQMYDDDAGLRAAVCGFVGTGLERGDLVVFVSGSEVATVSAYLEGAGISAGAALDSGQLQVMSIAEVEPDADGSVVPGLAQRLGRILQGREEAGYATVRMGSEVGALVVEETLEAMITREALAAALTATHPMVGMCFYDRRLFGGERLGHVEDQHDAVVVPGDVPAVLHDDPILSITRLAAGGLRVVGEIDISNGSHLRDALAVALAADADGDLTIDLSGLAFVDVVGLRHLVEAARRHPRRRLVLVTPSADVRRLLNLSGWSVEPNLVVEIGGGRV